MLDINAITNTEVDKKQFHKIVGEIYSLYTTEALSQNKNLTLSLNWKVPYFTAWANKGASSHYSINFWGGLARIPGMLTQTWEFIVCHELGHILGGLPKHKSSYSSWASSEGQSDHFAITECLPKYYKTFQKEGFDSTLSLPVEIDRCLNSHISVENQNICLKVLRAGRGMAEVLNYLSLSDEVASYESIAPSVDQTLHDSYPTAQCRIDIFYQQSTCTEKKACPRNSCWYVK
jgi:hypothetical protein